MIKEHQNYQRDKWVCWTGKKKQKQKTKHNIVFNNSLNMNQINNVFHEDRPKQTRFEN